MYRARLVPIVIALCLVATSSALAKKKNKNVRDGVFTSPLGDYKVAVPNLAFGTHMDQNFLEHGGSLSFSSDLGEVYLILSQEVGPDVATAVGDPSRATEALTRYLEDYVVPDLLRKAAPRTQITFREATSLGTKPAYFAVASMPEGAVIEDVRTHKRMDDIRGLLIFGEGKYVYVVGAGGGSDLLGAEKSTPPIEEKAKELRQRAEGFYSKVTFTRP